MARATAIFAVTLALVTTAIAAQAQKTITTGDFSGWMEDYKMLSFDEKRNEIGASKAAPGAMTISMPGTTSNPLPWVARSGIENSAAVSTSCTGRAGSPLIQKMMVWPLL